jgi:hypothetical protein
VTNLTVLAPVVRNISHYENVALLHLD